MAWISVCAPWLPTVSISQAVLSTSSRACSMRTRDCAIQCCTMPWSAIGRPKVTRDTVRRHISSSARSAMPMSRMQWWIRPGPSRACAIAKPSPSSATRCDAGTRTESKTISACPPWLASVNPKTFRPRTTFTPGVSRGTRIIDCWRCRGADGSVLPITMKIRQFGFIAPEDHHLRPLTTYSSPSRSILASMFVASELATSGSVMQKAERICPSSSGASQRSFCSAVPNIASTSMLPVSGAEQFRASGARIGLRPLISASGAYWRLVRPAPCSPGRKRFHRPRLRASALSFSTTGGVSQKVAGSASSSRDCSARTASAG